MFIVGLMLGVAFGVIVVGFLAVGAYERGFTEALERRKAWRAELVARQAVADAPAWLPPQVAEGRRLFYSATDQSLTDTSLGGISCASCHPEGRDDGRVVVDGRGPASRSSTPECSPDRRRDDDGHEDEAGRCAKQPLVVGDEIAELGDHVLAVAELVAERLEHGVRDDEPDRGVAVPLVQHGHPFESKGRFEPGRASHQQELAQDEVGADQPRDPAQPVESVARAARDLETGAGPPQNEDDQDVREEEEVDGLGPGPRRLLSNRRD